MRYSKKIIGLSPLLNSYPRVYYTVQYISKYIDEDEERCCYQNRSHNYWKIELFERVNRYFTNSFPSKNVLDKKSACQQLCKPTGHCSYNGIQRIA